MSKVSKRQIRQEDDITALGESVKGSLGPDDSHLISDDRPKSVEVSLDQRRQPFGIIGVRIPKSNVEEFKETYPFIKLSNLKEMEVGDYYYLGRLLEDSIDFETLESEKGYVHTFLTRYLHPTAAGYLVKIYFL